jgi:bifunctional DNase/RNase
VGRFFTTAILSQTMQAAIDAVRVAGTPEGPVPVVVLGTDDTDDILPIFIGFDEATAIARGLEAADIGRPLTHDLLLDVMEELGARLDRVVVTAVEDATYLADLHLTDPRGEDVVVDARPSDGLAIAARTNAPIEVEPSVFEDGRRAPETFDELDDIREVSEIT